MGKRVNFGSLERLLQALGFVKARVKGSHVAWKHDTVDGPLVLRDYRLSERVDGANLAMVRKGLIALGFIAEDEFDRQLHATAG
jgi:hypothetical protein